VKRLNRPQEDDATRPYFAYKFFGPATYKGGAAVPPDRKMERIPLPSIYYIGGVWDPSAGFDSGPENPQRLGVYVFASIFFLDKL
jgi:hypothetical protein